MSNLRIVIPIVVQFSVRYAFRTGLLQRMREYAQPIVLLRWRDPVLEEELRQAGIEVYPLPEARCGVGYTRIKHQLDVWHRGRLRSRTTAIDARRLRLLSPPTLRQRVRDVLYKMNVSLPGMVSFLLGTIGDAVENHTNVAQFRALLRDTKTDAILSLTPYFQQEQLLLYAAKQLRLTLCASILSFDNITTRGWIPVTFDAYFLWNRFNENELYRAYPEARSSRVEIVGAPQFDFYWDPTYVWDEGYWREQLGLPPGRPVILFGGGHYLVAPHEPHWLWQLDEAIESGDIPGRPVILFRRHPNDPLDRWIPILQQAKHVVHDDPWKIGPENPALANIRRSDIEKLASTLAHSHVHVNASSTMTVDGAIFDRPQVGPAYDDRPGRTYDRIVKDLYLREHYLPITRSGGLAIANSRDELIDAIRTGLDQPGLRAEGRSRLVRDICTYADGCCTERLNQALRSFLLRRDVRINEMTATPVGLCR